MVGVLQEVYLDQLVEVGVHLVEQVVVMVVVQLVEWVEAQEMEQDYLQLDVEGQEALQANLPFVQLTHVEDDDRLEQVVVVVEQDQLGGFAVAVEHAWQVVQLTVQLNLLEDYYRPAEEVVEVLLAEQVVVEQKSDCFDADVEQVQWALQSLQPYVQLNLVADGYKSAHYIQQVAQQQQKDLHYYQKLQKKVQEYLANSIWEGVCDYYEALINDDALDYPEHDYHAQIAGQQYELSVGYLEGFQA